MNKKIYDEVGITSVKLNELLLELQKCRTERDNILSLAETETSPGRIKELTERNLKKFTEIVQAIKRLQSLRS